MNTNYFDTSKATLYICIRDIINNACKTENPTPEVIKSSIDSGNIKITDEFWYEATIYAQKVINDNDRNDTLNNAYGFYSYNRENLFINDSDFMDDDNIAESNSQANVDVNTSSEDSDNEANEVLQKYLELCNKVDYARNHFKNEDLISMATMQVASKFNWLVDKYYQLHVQYTDETLIIGKFSKLVSLIIPSYLADLYRKVSEEKDFEDLNIENEKPELKHGRSLKSTVTCASLNQNNSTDEDECITLADTLVSNTLSPEDSYNASNRILDYLSPIINNALELKNYFCRYNGVSTDELLAMEKKMTRVEVFKKLKSDFSLAFNVNLDDLMFSEQELTYSGQRTLHKAYDDYRSSSDKKVKKYIMDKYSYLVKSE